MFFKNYQILFLSLLISGTFVAVSSNSWFTSWMGLEINLMSMIPLMLINLDRKLTEAAIKYFLAQAMASVILILSVSLSATNQESLNMEMLEILIVVSLIIKAGIAPFHFWFPQVANNLKWIQCFLIFSWQKIAPLILLTSFSIKLMLPVAASSALVGAFGGFNQILTKLILTYSSISHSGWMLLSIMINFNNWIIYFLIYCILSISIVTFMVSNQTKKINQIFFNEDSILNKTILSMNMFSLGGLPPLLGFAAKLMVIISSLASKILIILVPLIFSSLISLFFYARVIYSNIMNTNKKTNFKNNQDKKSIFWFYIVSLTLNLLTPVIFILT